MSETRDNILAQIKTRLGDKILHWNEKSARRIYIEVAPADIRETFQFIFRDLKARFQIATGIDNPPVIEILYHLAFDYADFLVTIKVKLPREAPAIDTLSDICVGTEWIEREMWEMLGVNFKGHPDMRHLLLRDDWPVGSYPYRRDFQKLS